MGGILRRGLQCAGDDSRHLRIGHRAWPARAIFVRKTFDPVFRKAPPPLAHSVLRMAEFGCDFLTVQAIRASKHNPASVRKRPRCLVPAQLGFKKTALINAEINRNRPPTTHHKLPEATSHQ